jgi:hypothetical protein
MELSSYFLFLQEQIKDIIIAKRSAILSQHHLRIIIASQLAVVLSSDGLYAVALWRGVAARPRRPEAVWPLVPSPPRPPSGGGVGFPLRGGSYFFISFVLGPLNSLLWYVPSSRYIWSSAPILFLQEQMKDINIITAREEEWVTST